MPIATVSRVLNGFPTIASALAERVHAAMALVGFDEIHWAVPEVISLTTVLQSAYELGSAATNRLIQRLQKPGAPRKETGLQHHLSIGVSSALRSKEKDFLRKWPGAA